MVSRISGLAALALLGAALYWTLRLEHADWLFVKGDAASIRQALRLAPGNAEYASSLAQAEPGHAVEILREAVARNPRNASLRLELGLAAEQQGDSPNAEASLREAMRLDTGFGPRWALSDFYFQHHDAEKFWSVTRAALAMSYGDVAPLFRNCWALSSDPRTILERAIPDRPAVLRRYLHFLVTEGRLDAAEPVAAKVLSSGGKDDLPSLLTYCDRQLEHGRGEPALVVWKGLAQRKLIPYRGGEVPVNGDFSLPPLAHGFDWQIATAAGIDADRTSSGLVLVFSGKQPENTEILSQYVPLLPHQGYSLAVRYSVSGIGAESGLICTLEWAGQDLLGGRGLLPGGAGVQPAMTRTIPFRTSDGATLGRLVVGYRRMPGTTRIEGSFTLRNLALTPAPGDHP
jgi:tetratricopeptide (TPR) repeat protein